MNRKKINKIALMAGIVLGVNFSSSLSSFAVQKDTDDSSVQIMQEKSAGAENTVTEAESSTDELEDKSDNTVIEDEDNLSDEEEAEETEETVELYDAYNVGQAVGNINSGSGTQYDYRALRIKSVNTTNLYFVNEAIAKAKAEKGADLVKSEIITTVNDTMDVYNFLLFINDADIDDYDYIWLTGVDESNIADFNNLLADKYLDRHEMPVFTTVDDLQLSIDNISDSIEAISEGSGTVEDYNNIGITDVTENNLSKINKMAASESQGKSLSISEIKELINSQPDSSEAIQRINNGEATLKDYEDIGAEGVNEENIQFVDSSLKGSNDYEIDSLLTRVEKVVKAYNTIKNIEHGQATLDDYMLLTICGVNSENIEYINESLSGSTFEGIDEIQSAVDKALHTFDCVNRINAGNAALEDYMVLEIKGVTVENLIYVNEELKGKHYIDREDIQSAVDEVVCISYSINRINNGTAALEDYRTLGITGVTPENLEYVNRCLEGQRYTNNSEIQAAVQKVVNNDQYISRINNGTASLDDYMMMGVTGVNEENISYVNSEIKGTINVVASNIQCQVDSIVKSYDDVYAINIGCETRTPDKYVREYLDITGTKVVFDTTEDSQFSLIRECILMSRKINNGRYLTKSEITSIIDRVVSEYEDAKVIIKEVKSEYYKACSAEERDLTPEEMERIIEVVKDERANIVDRIYLGCGTVGDFNEIGETRVTSDNIDVINEDIKKSASVRRASEYRLENLDEAVTKGLAIYNINEGIVSKDTDGNVKEYSELGKKVQYSSDAESENRIIQEYILIKQKMNYGNLDRTEILDAIDEVSNNIEDFRLIIPKTYEEIIRAEAMMEQELSGDEVQTIVEKVRESYSGACKRLCCGMATVEDYKLYGETRVTYDNIAVINKDIKLYAGISMVSNYRVENLNEAVTKGLVVYNINKNVLSVNSHGNIEEFAKLGMDIEYSTDPESQYRLVEDNILINQKIKGDNLSRSEILNAKEDVSNNIEDCKILLPKICEEITTVEIEMGQEISSDQVQLIVDQVKDTYQKACIRIVSGNATVDDYKLYGESRVNDNNIESINTDVKLFITITRLSDYRLAGINEAVTKGLAIYDINRGLESKDSDGYVREFKTLGVNIESSTEASSINNLVDEGIFIQRRINDKQLLTRVEILDIVKQVEDNPDSAKVKIPMILTAISEKDMQEGRTITGEEVQTIVDECLKNN